MSKEYKHSEQTQSNHKDEKRFKISYWGYINTKSTQRLRAYKIIYAENEEDARNKADIYQPLIYDITEI